jgi:monoamine oxidase
MTLDLAIIGAGAAGTYVAYHAALLKPDWSISLFERTDRVGGRLFSGPTNLGGANVELGGMRFHDGHHLVTALIDELGLATRPFRTAHADNRLFLRGYMTPASEGAASGAYTLDAAEAGLSPDQLMRRVMETAVPEAFHLSQDDWRRVRRDRQFLGRPLRDFTLTDVYRAALSDEAARLLVATLGYMSGLGPHNAADAIPYLIDELGTIDDQTTPVDGMAAIPLELARRFAGAGGQVLLEHDLHNFSVIGSGNRMELELTFANGQMLRSKRLVLALPRPAVDAMSAATPLLQQPAVSALVGSTIGYPALKLYLWYDAPWWRDDGFMGRRITTDLPARKSFYLDAMDAAGQGGPALMMAAFADGTDVDAWRSLPKAGVGATASASHHAPAGLVAEAHDYLKRMHGLSALPEPVGSAYMHWGADPRQPAWHFWRAGVNSDDVRQRISQPLADVPVYICGEAWSTAQAWVEGAFEGARAVVDRLADA